MIIIASKPGQLGNSLFLYAHFIGFALERKFSIANPSFNQYAEYFDSTSADLFCRFPKKKKANVSTTRGYFLKELAYHLCFYCGRIIHRLKIDNYFVKCIYLDWHQGVNLCHSEKLFKSKLIFVQGWNFRCAEYVNQHYEEIRKFFFPKKQYLNRINNLISEAKQKCDLLIGVHIRHGDYKKFQRGKYYYEIEQYKEIMLKIIDLFPQKTILFLVCTNSNEDISTLNEMNIIRGTNHELEDLYLLSKCDYLLGPPSTYTMWASFYGQVPLYQIHDARQTVTLGDFRALKHG